MKRTTVLAFLGVFLIVIAVSFSVWAETEELLLLQKIKDTTKIQALGIQTVKSKVVGNLYSATVTDFKYGTTSVGNVSVRLVPSTGTLIIFPMM